MKKDLPEEDRKLEAIKFVRSIEEILQDGLKDYPDYFVIEALANLLTRKCLDRKVDKKYFLERLSQGWDYHNGK
jgi:hypothetical protein